MANPAVVVPIPDQTVTKGQTVSLSLRPNLIDPDAVDRLVYSIAGLPTGTGISIDPDTGVVSASAITAEDIAAIPFTAVVTAVAASNSGIIGSFDLPFDGVEEEPPVAATYYVSSTATGAGNGSQASPWTASQASLLNIATLVPTPVTDVIMEWEPGNYDNQPYIPRYGGINSSIKLKNRVGSAGVVRFRGPQSGAAINYGIELRLGIYSGVTYTASYVEFERASDRNFEVDGQTVFGTGGGEVGKGEAPDDYARVKRGVLIESLACVVDIDMTRTAGWNGVDIGPFATGTYRINYTQHGTPFYPDGNDFGDMVWLPDGNSSTQRHLFDASATASRSWTRGGHGGPQLYGGTGAFRCQTLNGYWGDVSTFTAGDGQRAGPIFSRTATGWHMYNCVINRNGQPADATFCELMKLEGTNNSISDSILRNSDHDAFNNSSFDNSWHARGGRISHCVIEHLNGTIADMRDYLDDGFAGATRISDYQIKNCILRNPATATRPGWEDEIIHVVCSTGVNWTNVIQIHGLTVEHATKDASQLYISISRGTSPPGKITIADALATYPNNFSNITVTTDCGLDDAPSAGTNIDAEDIATYYTLNPADTTSKATGVSLTLANGAGVSSTTLVVDDSRWFDDPQDGAPPFGQQSEGFFVHLNGANRQYTAINYTTHTITLASAASWSDNAPVNKKITSGTTPNRGCIR